MVTIHGECAAARCSGKAHITLACFRSKKLGTKFALSLCLDEMWLVLATSRTRPSTDSKGTFGGDHWLQRSKAKEG